MNSKLRHIVLAALTGSLFSGMSPYAVADSTTDLVQALISKGVLTEEEGALLTKGHAGEVEAQKAAEKKDSKGKLKVSSIIDNATLYGDIRARYETRRGEDSAGLDETRDRGRYKLTLGVKTEAGDWYSDIALSMGARGRSDNATFGSGLNGENTKETTYIKRAMLGWKATDWLKLEAGRIANPLYTTAMVWDADLTLEGLVEKVDFKTGNINWFGNFAQSQYRGDRKDFSDNTADAATNNILAFQGGAKFPITDTIDAKAALTFTKYTNSTSKVNGGGTFVPGLGTVTGGKPAAADIGTAVTATNDLRTIEIPAEVNFKLANNMKLTAFGDYVKNLDGDDRFDAAVAAGGANAAAIRAAGNDDDAWMLGVGLASKQGKAPQQGDWSAKIWYQDVGVYALDPNTVDSDYMDSRVNMKGIIFKAEYLFRDNVFINFAAGHGKRKNSDLAAVGSSYDAELNLDKYDLYQMDVTYKF